ncbi:MAG: class I SAM-dependent methyltransferase [Candidatus Levyibacteriota bacterium]|jgi:ubiquinone/menaquinone biosynthesis C-methylase UbiE
MAQDFYDKVAKKFGNYTTPAKSIDEFPYGEPEKIFKEKLLALSGEDKVVLDAGCGDGRFTLSIARYFKKAIGNDTSGLMLKAALKLRGEKEISNVEFIERPTNELDYPENYFDVIYSRRSPTNYPLFYKMLKPGGYVLYIGIGETDAEGIKKIFGRGQNYGQWNNPALKREAEKIEQGGFKIVYAQDFYYNEYYLSYSDLDIFLQGVPIFEDYDSLKDKKHLEEYAKKFQKEKGIDLPRHRIVLVAKKIRI